VINNSPDVSAETREQVQRAIADLDYHPNAQAISLSRNRSNIVGMIVDRAGDAFFGPMVDGACQALAERGRFMLLAQTDNLEQPSAIEALLRSRRIDGLILVLPLEPSLEQARNLAKQQLPLVLVDLHYDIEADYISVDSYRGAYDAIKYLIELGHRRIGIIYNREDIPVGQVRLRGYQAALAEYGIRYDPELAIQGKWGVTSGRQGAEQLLALPERPTAIFAGDDQMAIGVLQTIYQHKLRVPEDISLVGFDDIEQAQYMHPALTTVRQPLREMGYTAGEHICRMIDGTAIGRLQLTFTPTLIIRDSTAPPTDL
jgi:LacI family transcriptional regulator